MRRVVMTSSRWHTEAHRALDSGASVEIQVRGWRARILRTQLRKMATAAVAYIAANKIPNRENFSLLYTVILLRFHQLLSYALAHGYSISWEGEHRAIHVSLEGS